MIQDRDTPIAKIVPLDDTKLPFRIIPATRMSKGIDDMVGFRPTGVTPEDIERIIAETRGDSTDEWLTEWLNSQKSTSTPR